MGIYFTKKGGSAVNRKPLSGNALKLIAALSMLLDHMGLMLFPRITFFRILGRLALPIYAYMIAEGCRYTRSKRRYFLGIFLLAAVCQAVYFFATGSLYFSILVTFSLGIPVVYALQNLQSHRDLPSGLLLLAAVGAVWLLNRTFTIDYGFWGCMLPVFASLPREKQHWRIGLLGGGLVLLALSLGGIQWYALAALPLLLLYSGKRGKQNMKYFFYIFYPAHLVLLELLAMLL